MRLTGKTVFICDSASLSGRAIAEKCNAEGAYVVRNMPCMEDGSDKSTLENPLRCSFQSEEEIEKTICYLLEQTNGLDALVVNFACVFPCSIENVTIEQFDKNYNYIIKPSFKAIQKLGEVIAKTSPHGKIVVVGSIHSEKPTGSALLYSCSMGALKNLSRETALFYGYQGIDTIYIDVGYIKGDEDSFKSQISTFYEGVKYKIPSGYIGSFADVAAAISWILSDECRYMNGAEIRIDGGLVLHILDAKRNYEIIHNKGG